MTSIVISRDRRLMLIDGVRCAATGRPGACSIDCRVMLEWIKAADANDSDEHSRICDTCCRPGRFRGAVTLAKEPNDRI